MTATRTWARSEAREAAPRAIELDPPCPLGPGPSPLEDWLVEVLEAHAPGLPPAGDGDWAERSPAEWRARRALMRGPRRGRGALSKLRVVMRRGVAVARPTEPVLLDEAVVEALTAELAGLIAAGHDRIVLDFGGVARMASRLLAALAEAHRACSASGGRLKLCGVRPELARAFAITGLDRLVAIEPDERAALSGDWPERPSLRPLPVAALRALGLSETTDERIAPSPVAPARRRRTSPPEGSKAEPADPIAFEGLVMGWLREGGTGGPNPPPSSDATANRARQIEAQLEGAIDTRHLSGQVLMDVVVLTPQTPHLEGEPAIDALRGALAALAESPWPPRVVIDLRHVAALDGRAVAVLADGAMALPRAGGALRLCHIPPALQPVIRQIRLDQLAETYPTIDEAVVASWDRAPDPSAGGRHEG